MLGSYSWSFEKLEIVAFKKGTVNLKSQRDFFGWYKPSRTMWLKRPRKVGVLDFLKNENIMEMGQAHT